MGRKTNLVFYVYLTERITNLDIKPTPRRYIGSGTAHYSDLSEFAESRDFNKLCLNHTYIGSSKELKEDCKNGEKFKKTILRICETRQEAFDVETEFQHKHNACKDSSYYNRYIAGEHEEWNTAGLKRTEKQIEEIRKRSTGRKQSAEVIEKRASKIRGRKMSKAFRERCRQNNLGKKVSAETKEKLRIWNTGRKKNFTAAQLERMSWKGKSHTEASKKKIGDANRGSNNAMWGMSGEKSPSWGRKKSPEEIQNIRDGLKRRFPDGRGSRGNCKPCTIDGITYKTRKEAMNKLGIAESKLCKILKEQKKKEK